MAVRRDSRGQWIFRKTVRLPDGRRKRIFGTPALNTKVEAERAERAAIARLLASGGIERKEVPTFDGFADEFMATYARTNNKLSEQEHKRSILKHHLRPAFGKKKLDQIGTREVEGLKAKLLSVPGPRKKIISEKRVNNVLTCLGKILRYARELELIEKVPSIKLLKTLPDRFDFLDFEELERLLAAARTDPQQYAMILVAADAGLRIGEILALRWEDLDLKASVPMLTVRRSDWQGHVGSPKSGRARSIPLTRRLAEALRAHRHLRGELVFSTGDGSALRWNLLKAPRRHLCRRAGLRHIGWHALRHTFCSALAMRGAPPRAIQELAGHASITTTMRYMHLAPIALREAIGLLEIGSPLAATK